MWSHLHRFSCITPMNSFNNNEFQEELSTTSPKYCSHPELHILLVFQVINDIPDKALNIYTYGSRLDKSRTRSGIFNNTPGNDIKIRIRNSDHYSAFRSERIAISGAQLL
ncbi:hypothetical protein TNCV_2898361 [Trichonephila clavipes]|nr:hypothetical protein TNCV_2898361 [Trichonephila clavipes]